MDEAVDVEQNGRRCLSKHRQKYPSQSGFTTSFTGTINKLALLSGSGRLGEERPPTSDSYSCSEIYFSGKSVTLAEFHAAETEPQIIVFLLLAAVVATATTVTSLDYCS